MIDLSGLQGLPQVLLDQLVLEDAQVEARRNLKIFIANIGFFFLILALIGYVIRSSIRAALKHSKSK